ncbi:hypothetical protein Tco_0512960, partial [Tanacetum coccineum]
MRYSWTRSSHFLLLPHPLQIHQDMFLSLIRRRTMRIPEKDLTDYLADRDDDDDKEEEEPSRDDVDDEDEDEDKEEEEEEEEHPAPADSVPPVHRMTARISIRD